MPFAGVRLGNGTTIYEAESMDRYGDPFELDLARAAERMDWHGIPAADLIERDCGLIFLDAEGFRFYTPAVMALNLRREDHRGALSETFLFRLHEISESGKVQAVPYCDLFNRSQRAAIRRYVKFNIHNVPYGGYEATLLETLNHLNALSRSDKKN